MSEVDHMKEDGEISDEEAHFDSPEEVYETVERPKLVTESRNNFSQLQTDSDSSSDSDIVGRVKKIQPRFQMIANQSRLNNSKTKNGSLWQNIIQEETLMDTMNSIDVTRKRKNDRGAEAYDFPQQNESAAGRNLKRRRMNHSDESSSSSNASSSRSRKRARKFRAKNRKLAEPVSKVLPNIAASVEGDDIEEFVNELALHLEEENVELIHRAVSVIGKKASLELFTTTQNVEREGGMLTMNRVRRRTPGGVFLFLLKESAEIDDESRRRIFSNDKKPAERKMSSEQMSKIPPNSPENSDCYVENEQRKSTSTADPNLLSQKILNVTSNDGGSNGIDIDFNDEMDVF